MNIQIAQEASATEQGWWHWAVWLEADGETLDSIESVEYILHPTFRDPVQHITDRSSHFRLNASGWGEFMIYIHIHLHDGSVLKKEHWLVLRGAPTRGFDPVYAAASKGLELSSLEIAEAVAGPTLFLSCSVTDRSVAAALIQALDGHGYRVLMSDDLDPDIPLVEILRSNPGLVNGAILLVSEVNSPHLQREVSALQQANLPILPVLLGPDAQPPGSIKSLDSLHLKDAGDMEQVAQAIVQWMSVAL
jgi:hypothetical protein